MSWEHWQAMIQLFVTLIISLTVHEAAHALFALWGGDRTAYYAGQVTLNPIPHMRREPFGMIVLPLISIYMSHGSMCFGFAHAPIDAIWAYHHPKKAALMSAAGPLANVLLATIAFAVLWFVGRPDSGTAATVRSIAGVFLLLNLLLAVFNFIPLPPLDGAGIVSGLYPPARGLYDAIQRIPYSFIVIFVLLMQVMPYLFGLVFNPINHLLPHPLPYRFG
ncbi:MAG TPA: site-2 protease family protein [Planctomycetota bacterium]|nr:site-2 protease family protein [Planctomycetota bacterium]